jgi:AraC-like DNA-binding protein
MLSSSVQAYSDPAQLEGAYLITKAEFLMGPKQYLLLRRMTLAHRALQAANPVETTVTEVATRFGFWHFGRFAGEYRALFGEAPSVTLGALKPRGRTDRTLFPSGETTCA